DYRYGHGNGACGSRRSPGRDEESRGVLVLLERRRRIVSVLVREAPLSLMPISGGHGLRGTEGLKVKYTALILYGERGTFPRWRPWPCETPFSAAKPSVFLGKQILLIALLQTNLVGRSGC